jgi:hypothetical protein
MDHSLDQSTLSDLSDNQEILLAVLQLSSATLSLVGSYTIVYKIVLNLNRNKTTTPYELIMLGLSGCDILASVTYAMGPFLLPRETSQRITALGDDSTCSKLGFLTQFACVWAVWYNALLSYYYLLTVRYQVKPLEFRRKYELWMHLSGVIFFSITAIVGLMGDWYSEERLTMACWIDEVPNGCRAAGNICYGSLAAYIFGGVPMAITLFSLIINNIVIYLFVRNTLLSSPTTAISSSAAAAAATVTATATATATSSRSCEFTTDDIEDNDGESKQESADWALSRSVQERLTKEVAIQGFLYVAAYLLTIIPGFVLSVLESIGFGEEDQGRLYPLLLLNAMMLPLQGFFNVFIYVKPSYSRFRATYPEEPMWFVLYQALFDPNTPRLSSTVAVPMRSGRVAVPARRYNNNNSLPGIVEEEQ